MTKKKASKNMQIPSNASSAHCLQFWSRIPKPSGKLSFLINPLIDVYPRKNMGLDFQKSRMKS